MIRDGWGTHSLVVGVAGAVLAGCTAGVGADAWPEEVADPYGQGPVPSPEFPTELAGWQLAETWNDTPRAFSGESWTGVAGPDGADFPSTMNGCAAQRFLVRWRSVSPAVDVATRWNQSDVVLGPAVVAGGGWLDLDGCGRPEVRLQSDAADGSTLTDVTVQVQRWVPAP